MAKAKAKKAAKAQPRAKAKPVKPTAKKAAKPTAKSKPTPKPKKPAKAKKPAKPKKPAKANKPAKAIKPAKAKKAAKPRAISKPAPPALESLFLEAIVLASPARVYAAWLDGGEHSAFTGGEASIDARIEGKHSAWSGYIEGRFVDLDPGRRIAMTWRTTEFDESDPDSFADVRLEPDGGGTRIVIEHTGLPPGGAQKYGTGWREFYFVPMRRYFEGEM